MWVTRFDISCKSAKLVLLLQLILISNGVLAAKPTKSCEEEDFLHYVKGGKHCLAIITVGELSKSTDTLIVYLHGDVSKGGSAEYLQYTARDFETKDTDGRSNGVVLIRHGYYDEKNRYSSGSNNGRRDNTTKSNNASIAEALRKLKQFHDAKKLVVVGHSAGALSAGAIIGQFSRLIDYAILVSCPCDTNAWSQFKGRSRNQRRQNPMKYVANVDSTVRVSAITGSKDSNTPVSTVSPFISRLVKNGIDAELIIIEGWGHDYSRYKTDVIGLLHNYLR